MRRYDSQRLCPKRHRRYHIVALFHRQHLRPYQPRHSGREHQPDYQDDVSHRAARSRHQRQRQHYVGERRQCVHHPHQRLVRPLARPAGYCAYRYARHYRYAHARAADCERYARAVYQTRQLIPPKPVRAKPV